MQTPCARFLGAIWVLPLGLFMLPGRFGHPSSLWGGGGGGFSWQWLSLHSLKCLLSTKYALGAGQTEGKTAPHPPWL